MAGEIIKKKLSRDNHEKIKPVSLYKNIDLMTSTLHGFQLFIQSQIPVD